MTPRPTRITTRTPARQRGASLVVTLVMLAVIAGMGVSAFLSSNSQFRMAANMQFQNVAVGNAESALSVAETWVASNYGNGGFATRASGGLYPSGTGPDPLTMTWDDTTSVKVDTLGTERYFIEQIVVNRILPSNSVGSCNVYGLSGPCPAVNVYRLTARGTSILGTARVVQSVYAVRINV
jgi:type IV pilus assembly protein PilX